MQRESLAEGLVAREQLAIRGRQCEQAARQLEPGREDLWAEGGRLAHAPSRSANKEVEVELPRFTRRVYDA